MFDCSEFIDYSLCDPSPLEYDSEDLSIGQFLELLPHPVLEPEESQLERSSTRTPPLDDSTFWVNDLVGSPGFFAPLASELIPDIPLKDFNGKIPVEDTYTADVKRYMERTGKVPIINVFVPEDDDSDGGISSHSDDPVQIPSTPVQRRRVAPLPGSATNQPEVFSRCSSATSSEASYYWESPIKNRTAARKEGVTLNRTARNEPKDEPPAKKPKGRKTFNSACAADDLASFAPVPNDNPTSHVIALSPVSSSSRSSDWSYTSSPSPRAVMTKKRKFEELESDGDLEFTAVQERKPERVTSDWEPINESYSWRSTNNRLQYRCTLCFDKGHVHLCTREGDMTRHLESLQHRPKSFFCPNSGCSRSFTRKDALKRHMSKHRC